MAQTGEEEPGGASGAQAHGGGPRSSQRSPYFAIDTGPLLIVGIDTGLGGPIDREQGEWLRRISREVDKPKILLTGKPLYVDGEHHPYPIEGGGTVDEIVRDPEHDYVAAIGGDIHNYQRYSVGVGGRDAPLHYIVSGGGGAYMSATHRIPKVDLDGVGEDDFRLLPAARRLPVLLQQALRPPFRPRAEDGSR